MHGILMNNKPLFHYNYHSCLIYVNFYFKNYFHLFILFSFNDYLFILLTPLNLYQLCLLYIIK